MANKFWFPDKSGFPLRSNRLARFRIMNIMDINKEYLSKAIDNFSKSKILIIGDTMLDRFIWGNVSRISPEAPVPVVEVHHETTLLGGAANVLNNAMSLGGNVLLCSVVGNDAAGRDVISKMDKLGVDKNGVIIEDSRPTTLKTRIIAQDQQVVRYDLEKRAPLSPGVENKILNFVDKKREVISGVIISDYGKGVVSKNLMKGLRDIISGQSIPVTVDPNVMNFNFYQDVTLITPNHVQAGKIAGIEGDSEESLGNIARKLLNQNKSKALLITRGKDGMTLFEEDGSLTHIKSVARKVYDVTGAGDTVIATLTLGMTSGLNIKSSAYLSNIAAGIVVGEVGTSTVTLDTLKKLALS